MREWSWRMGKERGGRGGRLEGVKVEEWHDRGGMDGEERVW